jgi:hypothetical protein
MNRIRTTLCLVAACLVAWAQPQAGYGQNVTSGSITGIVRDAQGGVLPGATVTATHVPTGTVYEGVTQADGTFSLLNVRVGGPYEVTIGLASFRPEKRANVQVNLGQATNIDVTLQLETLTETVTVIGEASSIFSPSNAGTSDNIEQGIIENLPTVQRSLQDFARVNPFFVQTATNQNPSALSVAGRSGRYNNLQIDGAVNNDLFGLADQATPGGQANTEPISIEAIEELQLVVSPYDVRQGNFSGGGINAVTRSGSNDFHGAAYYYFRNQDWVGDGPDDRPIATFSDKTPGFSFGGPIAQNRAFFFGNAEFQRRETPSGFSIDGSSGQTFGRQAEAQRILDVLQNRYGYDPGGFEEFIRENPNDKIFVRTDFNVSSGHQLIVRHNYVKGQQDVGTQTNTTYKFADNFYNFNSETNSTVGQLNSAFGRFVNEARFSYQRIRDFRATDSRFPQVNVRLSGGQNFRIGTEQFSTANELDQDIIELHNDLTWVQGSHQFTIGTHNELFKFRNLFIRDNFGTYDFASVDTFEQGLAQAFDHSFSRTSDPQQSAEFWVYQIGLYAGDQWRLRDNFTMTYGVRLDMPIFPDEPAANAQVEALYGFGTDVVPSSMTWSPRAGFNWDLSRETTRQQVRGGIGLFGGRTPYVWLSNQYTNTGNEFTRVNAAFNAANQIPFVADPDAQPRTVGRAATNEINLVDPDYTFPQLVRGNIGYDRSLGWQGLVASAELLFSKTVKDIDYANLNLVPTATRPDGRPVFSRLNGQFSDVVLLRNTSEGSSWTMALKLDRPFRNNWFASASYLFGRSRSVNDGGSSQARSNWINNLNPGDINDVPLGISNFDPGHRINLAASYQIPAGPASVTLSMFYNGQSGRPYAYAFFNDANGDFGTTNDLLYIPSGPGDVQVTNGSVEQLLAFLQEGDCDDLPSGGIMERNTCRAPWTNQLDFRAAVDLGIQRVRTEVTFDVLNLINLFDSESGLVEYATFNSILAAGFRGTTPDGRYIYELGNAITRGQRFERDDLRSRWQAQLGLRLSF